MENIIAEQSGYLLAYLSNENAEAVNIHFDDFEVYQGKTNVVSAVDYYPFGMEATTYTRTAADPAKYLYNAGAEKNELTGNYEMHYRHYDPTIGRLHGIDPYAALFKSQTPYHYANNDPIYYSDPSGGIPRPLTLDDLTVDDWSLQAHATPSGGAPWLNADNGSGFGRENSFANGTHWSTGLRSSEQNAFFMSGSAWMDMYGPDPNSSDVERAEVARNVGMTYRYLVQDDEGILLTNDKEATLENYADGSWYRSQDLSQSSGGGPSNDYDEVMEQWANDYQASWAKLSKPINDFMNENPEVVDFIKSLNQTALNTKNSVEMDTEKRLLAAVSEANSLGINTQSRIFYQLVGASIGAFNGASLAAAAYISNGSPKKVVYGATMMGGFVGAAAGFHVGTIMHYEVHGKN